MRKVSFEDSMEVGHNLNIDFNIIDPMEFWKGMQIELEHGQMYPDTDIIPKIHGEDNLDVIGNIALVHLSEIPDYYTRLIRIERE